MDVAGIDKQAGPLVRIEKASTYAGFDVLIVKESNRHPYRLLLDSNVNHRDFLVQALQDEGWQVDLEQFAKGKPVWFKMLTGPTQTVLTKELYQFVGSLYNAQRLLAFEAMSDEDEECYETEAQKITDPDTYLEPIQEQVGIVAEDSCEIHDDGTLQGHPTQENNPWEDDRSHMGMEQPPVG